MRPIQALTRRVFLTGAIATAMAALAGKALAQTPNSTEKKAMSDSVNAGFKELIEWSMKEKRGLTFFINGQTVGGGVVRWVGSDAVELKSQQYARIIVRLDRVDAIAQ